MNDPQIWTLIGVVTALIFASNRQLSTSIRREMAAGFREQAARIEGLKGELGARIDGSEQKLGARIDGSEQRLGARIDGLEQRLDARIDGLEQRLDARIDGLETKMDMRFLDVDHRLESLEGDMRIIKTHLIGQSSLTRVRG